MTIRLLLLAVVLALVACSDKVNGAKNAKGDTQVKYIVCGPSESNCFVSARFKDLDSCNEYKEQSDMVCDRRSTPGTIICKQGQPSYATAYCLP